MAKGVKLDDNKWHTFRLMRVGRSFTITIDNAHRPQGIVGDLSHVAKSIINLRLRS